MDDEVEINSDEDKMIIRHMTGTPTNPKKFWKNSHI